MTELADKREPILARLAVVAATVAPYVFRNTVDIPERERPAIVILDGDEEMEHRKDGPVTSPCIVAATPEIFFLLDGVPDSDPPVEGARKLGGALNTLRTAFIKAVVTDNAGADSLVALCHNGEIRYLGFATALGAGRSLEGEAGISFAFVYALKPHLL